MNLKLYHTTRFSFRDHHITNYAAEFAIFSRSGTSVHKERGAKQNVSRYVFSSLRTERGVRLLSRVVAKALCRRRRGMLGTAMRPVARSAHWCVTSPVAIC